MLVAFAGASQGSGLERRRHPLRPRPRGRRSRLLRPDDRRLVPDRARLSPAGVEALGFRRFRLRWLWISFAVVVATTIVAVAVEPFLHGGEDQGLGADRWQPEHAGAFAANVVVLVLLGPFAEELFFRGLGVRVLMLYGGLVAILVTGVIFGLVHGLLGALPPLVLFGIGLAWVRLRSASVWPAFIGHAAYNGLGILVLVLSWSVGVTDGFYP